MSAEAPDPLRAARLERRVLAGIVALALVLMLLGIHWGLPNYESWNGDDISPAKPLRVVHDWLRGNHKYPYLHWWLNLLLYAPWLLGVAAAGEVDLGCFPRLAPECFADPLRDMTVFMGISRLLSVAMGLGIVLLTRRLALALHGDRAAALFAALLCAASPTFVFFCHTGNLDVPVLFWFTASLVAAVSVWRRGALVDHAAFGLLAGCTLATKDAVLAAYVLPGLALLGVHAARVARESGARGGALLRAALLDRRLVVLGALVLGLYALVQNALFNPSGLVEHFRIWTEGGPVLNYLRGRHRGPIDFLWHLSVSLEALLGAPMLAFCAAGAVASAFAARRSLLLWLPFLSYAGLGLLPSFVEPRLVLPLLPLLAVWGGVLASRLVRRPGAPRVVGAALLALVASHEILLALSLDVRMIRDSRYAAEAWLAANVPRGARVATLSGSGFLPRLGRMGYDVRVFLPGEVKRGVLEASDLEWALFNSIGHPLADTSYLKDLRSGRLGYEAVFEVGRTRAQRGWLETRQRPGVVSPRITVLRRDPRSAAGNGEPVADAAHALDVAARLAELPAQRLHVRVDHAQAPRARLVGERLDDRAPRQHLPAADHEEHEHAQLRRRETHAAAGHLDPAEVRVDDEHAVLLRARRRRRLPRAELAAQQRVHPGAELSRGERRRQEVVGAALEGEHSVELRVLGREDEHSEVAELRVLAEAAAEGHPRHVGQHRLDDQQVRLPVPGVQAPFGARGHGLHVGVAELLADPGVPVFRGSDRQDSRGIPHVFPSPASRKGAASSASVAFV